MKRCMLALTVAIVLCAQPASAQTPPFVRTLVVSPDVLDPVGGGQRLLNALAGLTRVSQTSPWLIRLEPGIYDLRGRTLTLRSFVAIEGSGQGATVIRSTGPGNAPVVSCVNALGVELRNLTVHNLQTGANSAALRTQCLRPRFANLLIRSDGQTSPVGFDSVGGLSMIEEMTVWMFNSNTASTAVRIQTTAALIRDLDVLMQNNAGFVRGLEIAGGGNLTEIQGLSVNLANGNPAVGLFLNNGAAEIQNADIDVGSGTGPGYGIVANGGNLTFTGSVLGSGNAPALGYGVLALGAQNFIQLTSSTIWGSTNSIRKDGASRVMVGASELVNPAVSTGGGTLRCVSSFNHNFVALNTDCQ